MADQATVTRALTVPLMLLGTAIAVIWLVNTSGVSGLFLIPIIFGAVFFWLQPAKMVAMLPPAIAMTLIVPGLPGLLTLGQALTILLAVWGIFARATVKGEGIRRSTSDWAILGFLGVMILLMVVRGFGMRIGGGTKYGGFGYVLLITSVMAYFYSPYVTLSRKNIVWILVATVVASAIPFAIEVSIIVTGGATGWLMGFFTLLPEYTMESVRVGEAGLARISAGRTLGIALIAMALVFRYNNPMKFLLRIAFLVGGMGLILYSGFRSVLVAIGMVVAWWFWARSRHRVGAAMLILFGFATAWVGAVVLGSSLPGPFQRALSFLPGVYVDPVVAASADASITWRLEIWKQCVKHVPEFLLVGRGIVTDVMPLAWMRREFYVTPEFYYEMKGYHSGPLSLLLDFGLPGFIAGTLFFVSVCREGWAFLRRNKPDYNDLIWRYYLYLLITTSVSALSFYLITGDVRASVPLFVVDAIVLRLVRKHLAAAPKEERVPASRPVLATWRDRPLDVPLASGAPART
jgi:hypothetical protein